MNTRNREIDSVQEANEVTSFPRMNFCFIGLPLLAGMRNYWVVLKKSKSTYSRGIL